MAEETLKQKLERERTEKALEKYGFNENFNLNRNDDGSFSINTVDNNNADVANKDLSKKDKNNDNNEKINNTDDSLEYQSNENNNNNGKKELTNAELQTTLQVAEARRKKIDKTRFKRLQRYSTRKSGGVLRYPLESLTEHTDYLQIDIEKYVPIGSTYASVPGGNNRYVTGSRLTNRAGVRGTNRLSTKPLVNDGTILLPIPANLADTNNVQFDTSTLNGLAAAGV